MEKRQRYKQGRKQVIHNCNTQILLLLIFILITFLLYTLLTKWILNVICIFILLNTIHFFMIVNKAFQWHSIMMIIFVSKTLFKCSKILSSFISVLCYYFILIDKILTLCFLCSATGPIKWDLSFSKTWKNSLFLTIYIKSHLGGDELFRFSIYIKSI